MATMDRFEDYLRKLQEIPLDEHTEHTGRAALEALLRAFAAEAAPHRATVQHEPKRQADKGAPDFKVTRQGMILGYVETKGVGAPLDKVLKSEQIKRYKELSDNILLTDYLHFIWIGKGGIQRETLCYATDLENPSYRLREDRVAAVAKLLRAFFSEAPEGIGSSQQLALALAARSRLLRDYLGEELVRQEREHREARLYGLYQVFRDQVFHELSLKEFADAFAQMLAYGLFLAKLNAAAGEVTLHNARQHVPGSFRLIRELVDFLGVLDQNEYREVRWVVEEVLSIVNGLNLPAIREDLSFRHRKAISRNVRAADEEEHRLFERDPFIYFYEHYLKAYDPEMREGRGVYYTPPPVVNFIIRAVDDILKATFGIHDGLADNGKVTLLDFACGTGTFLLEVFERIFDNIGGPESGKADKVVREHILTHLFGFEYLIAPYTIAHLKLSQYLLDRGHPLHDHERLQVFLTNTLEPIEPQRNLLLPAVTAEVEAAQRVKDREILVITGNPPYSGHSKNKGRWITAAINAYKRVDGEPLGERNPKWLNDDYVKFIRFAQMKMDAVPEGIVAVITNHSWLDNPTFRGMRQSLMQTFQEIYVLDLHGSTKRRERAPDGSDDDNVFDIQQGVAISIFVKKPGLDTAIWRADIWGKRLAKYRALADGSLKSVDWEQLQPASPFYLFAAQDRQLREEYDAGWRLVDMMRVNVLGFQTHRDNIAISFDPQEMIEKGRELENDRISLDDFASRYRVSKSWVALARQEFGEAATHTISRVRYRPFDDRWTYYEGLFNDRPRAELVDHVIGRSNLVLGVGRAGVAVPERPWELVTIADTAVDANIFRRGGVSLSPLYLFDESHPRENLSPSLRSFIDARYEDHYTPEEILGYIYAVLHAPTYRSRYSEFLRIDFPRIRFPDSSDDFDTLSKLGWALVQAHLLRQVPHRGLAGYQGKGDHAVDFIRYAPAEQEVWINKTQSFRPVPQHVWDFHIGGYQVLDKYLKSRKGRTLSLNEIDHVARVADSLAFTIEQMARIDDAYNAAFPDRG